MPASKMTVPVKEEGSEEEATLKRENYHSKDLVMLYCTMRLAWGDQPYKVEIMQAVKSLFEDKWRDALSVIHNNFRTQRSQYTGYKNNQIGYNKLGFHSVYASEKILRRCENPTWYKALETLISKSEKEAQNKGSPSSEKKRKSDEIVTTSASKRYKPTIDEDVTPTEQTERQHTPATEDTTANQTNNNTSKDKQQIPASDPLISLSVPKPRVLTAPNLSALYEDDDDDGFSLADSVKEFLQDSSYISSPKQNHENSSPKQNNEAGTIEDALNDEVQAEEEVKRLERALRAAKAKAGKAPKVRKAKQIPSKEQLLKERESKTPKTRNTKKKD